MSYDWRKWLPRVLTEEGVSTTQPSSVPSSSYSVGPSSSYNPDWTTWFGGDTRPSENANKDNNNSLKGESVFISYAREDFDSAKRLYKDLSNEGLNVWLDKISLLPGQKWKIAIRDAIEKSTYFIALLSKSSIGKRGYIQKELKEAMDVLEEFPPSDIFLIPARLDDCDPSYQQLKEINYADLFPNWNEGLKKILQAIKTK